MMRDEGFLTKEEALAYLEGSFGEYINECVPFYKALGKRCFAYSDDDEVIRDNVIELLYSIFDRVRKGDDEGASGGCGYCEMGYTVEDRDDRTLYFPFLKFVNEIV